MSGEKGEGRKVQGTGNGIEDIDGGTGKEERDKAGGEGDREREVEKVCVGREKGWGRRGQGIGTDRQREAE